MTGTGLWLVSVLPGPPLELPLVPPLLLTIQAQLVPLLLLLTCPLTPPGLVVPIGLGLDRKLLAPLLEAEYHRALPNPLLVVI